jgi:D-serine deaminase-like pyridoxal phosphate-dependent protein
MSASANEWYTFKETDRIDTPALMVYPDRVAQNIKRLKAMVPATGVLRPHVKTNKSVDATRMMIAHGINKFKCATITEAEMLGRCKAPDALLAYQPTRQKLDRLLKVLRAHPDTAYSCLVDNLKSGQMMDAFAREHGIVLSVFIDLNAGMNRTGIAAEPAFNLFVALSSLSGLNVRGFHAYDGHIRNLDVQERTAHCDADFAAVEDMREKISQAGYPYPLLIAGGSPTFLIHSKRKNVECSPGTFIFWDKGYHDTIPDQDFLYAALVVSRVVSMPTASKICIDLGYKCISSENELQNRVFFLNAPDLKPYSQSEEHMVIEVGEGHNYQIGDLFYVVPIHICPTVAMYDQAHTVIEHSLYDTWPIQARDHESFNNTTI